MLDQHFTFMCVFVWEHCLSWLLKMRCYIHLDKLWVASTFFPYSISSSLLNSLSLHLLVTWNANCSLIAVTMKNHIFSGAFIWVGPCISKWICFHEMSMSKWGHSGVFFFEDKSTLWNNDGNRLYSHALSIPWPPASQFPMGSVEFQG